MLGFRRRHGHVDHGECPRRCRLFRLIFDAEIALAANTDNVAEEEGERAAILNINEGVEMGR